MIVPKGDELVHGGLEGSFYSSADAMIVYTSGTTSKPKGNFPILNTFSWKIRLRIVFNFIAFAYPNNLSLKLEVI